MRRYDIKPLLIYSIGVDSVNMSDSSADTTRFPIFKQFHHLEKQISKDFNHDSYCIIRSFMWHQFFFYFGPMMEDQNKIKLNVAKKSKWNTIDLADLVDATYNLSSKDYNDDDQNKDVQRKSGLKNSIDKYVLNIKKKNKTMFEFTGRHNITAEELVKRASEDLDVKEMTYEKVDKNELYDYLNRIHHDNRFRHRPSQKEKDLSDCLTNFSAPGENRHYTFPLGQFLNKEVINMLIEFWEMADADLADKTTEHLAKALERDPVTIKQFFKHNRDQFRRLK